MRIERKMGNEIITIADDDPNWWIIKRRKLTVARVTKDLCSFNDIKSFAQILYQNQTAIENRLEERALKLAKQKPISRTNK